MEESKQNDDIQLSEEMGALPDFQALSPSQIKQEFIKERKQLLIVEKDLFKSLAQCRRLQDEIKQLQEINTINAKNTNNTSSSFSLPSEFKDKWNELVSEKILDAFPDFLDKFKLLVPLVQNLFIIIRELLEQMQSSAILDIAKRLNLIPKNKQIENKSNLDQLLNEKGISMLNVKLRDVFQEYCKQIFQFRIEGSKSDGDGQFEDEAISQIINEKFKPKVIDLVQDYNEGEFVDAFEENISSSDFIDFFKCIIELNMHMFLNDPQITLELQNDIGKYKSEISIIEQFDFRFYQKNDYYCIDGFPMEQMPAVVVLPQPKRQGYTYQNIKPAVIVFSQDDLQNSDIFKEGEKDLIQSNIIQKVKEQEEREREKKAMKEANIVSEELKDLQLSNQINQQKENQADEKQKILNSETILQVDNKNKSESSFQDTGNQNQMSMSSSQLKPQKPNNSDIKSQNRLDDSPLINRTPSPGNITINDISKNNSKASSKIINSNAVPNVKIIDQIPINQIQFNDSKINNKQFQQNHTVSNEQSSSSKNNQNIQQIQQKNQNSIKNLIEQSNNVNQNNQIEKQKQQNNFSNKMTDRSDIKSNKNQLKGEDISKIKQNLILNTDSSSSEKNSSQQIQNIKSSKIENKLLKNTREDLQNQIKKLTETMRKKQFQKYSLQQNNSSTQQEYKDELSKNNLNVSSFRSTLVNPEISKQISNNIIQNNQNKILKKDNLQNTQFLNGSKQSNFGIPNQTASQQRNDDKSFLKQETNLSNVKLENASQKSIMKIDLKLKNFAVKQKEIKIESLNAKELKYKKQQSSPMIEQKKEESNINGFKVHNVIRDRSKSDFDNSGIGDGDPSLIGGIVVGSSIDNFNESNFSWRSAANNVNKVNLKQFNNRNLNQNINSLKYSKDPHGYDQILENSSSFSLNKGQPESMSNYYGGRDHELKTQNSFSNLGKPPTSFSKNLQKIKEDHHQKIQALTKKVEEEKNRLRQKSQNRQAINEDQKQQNQREWHNYEEIQNQNQQNSSQKKSSRSRSKSQTIQNIQRYSQELMKHKQKKESVQTGSLMTLSKNDNSKGSNEMDEPRRSISPYQRWKMMPKQINKAPIHQNFISVKNPYVQIQTQNKYSIKQNDIDDLSEDSYFDDKQKDQIRYMNQEGFGGNQKNIEILRQFQQNIKSQFNIQQPNTHNLNSQQQQHYIDNQAIESLKNSSKLPSQAFSPKNSQINASKQINQGQNQKYVPLKITNSNKTNQNMQNYTESPINLKQNQQLYSQNQMNIKKQISQQNYTFENKSILNAYSGLNSEDNFDKKQKLNDMQREYEKATINYQTVLKDCIQQSQDYTNNYDDDKNDRNFEKNLLMKQISSTSSSFSEPNQNFYPQQQIKISSLKKVEAPYQVTQKYIQNIESKKNSLVGVSLYQKFSLNEKSKDIVNHNLNRDDKIQFYNDQIQQNSKQHQEKLDHQIDNERRMRQQFTLEQYQRKFEKSNNQNIKIKNDQKYTFQNGYGKNQGQGDGYQR